MAFTGENAWKVVYNGREEKVSMHLTIYCSDIDIIAIKVSVEELLNLLELLAISYAAITPLRWCGIDFHKMLIT